MLAPKGTAYRPWHSARGRLAGLAGCLLLIGAVLTWRLGKPAGQAGQGPVVGQDVWRLLTPLGGLPPAVRAPPVGGLLAASQPRPRDLMQIYQSASPAVRERAHKASVTVIVSCFIRPDGIGEILSHWLEQSANVERVLVYLSGSPVREQYLAVLGPIMAAQPRVELFESGLNLGYFGRLQLGIQIFTEFVVFTDDDIVQGKHALAGLITGFYGEYKGLLGVRGCNYVCENDKSPGLFKRFVTGPDPTKPGQPSPLAQSDIRSCSQKPARSHLWPPSGSEVDTLFSFWLMPSEWVRTLFMEPPPTYRTAEDMHISFMVRKYLGRPTYMLNGPPGVETANSRRLEYPASTVDFQGNLREDIGFRNRSWVDDGMHKQADPTQAAKAKVLLPQLQQALAGPIQDKVADRKYNWERDQVLLLLAERGNSMSRIRLKREGWAHPARAIVLYGASDLVPGTRLKLDLARADPHTSILIVCHQPACLEYKQLAEQDWWLGQMLFGSHKALLESKLYRLQPPTDHAAIFFSRLLLDMSTVLGTLRVSKLYSNAKSMHSSEKAIGNFVAEMHGIESVALNEFTA